MKNIKKLKFCVLIFLMIFLLIGCTNKNKLHKLQYFNLFDTVTRIIGYEENDENFQIISEKIYKNLLEYNKLYDIYNNYEGINNIKTINDNAGIRPVNVDKRIIDLIKFSKRMYKETNGNVNIAFGSVLNIWHNYRTEGIENPINAKLPSLDELREANKHIDIDKIIIDEEQSTIFLEDKNMSLDVGSIAKGYAVQCVVNEIKEKDFSRGILDVGGNICAIGSKLPNTPWIIGIQNPDNDENNPYVKKVSVVDKVLVTSGDYQRYYTVNNKKYHHIINKNTLFPSTNFRAVSIICKDAGKADAYSTAIFNMDFETGLKLINSNNDIEAVWIFKDGSLKYSENFEKMIVE